jgi:hypothetical protein
MAIKSILKIRLNLWTYLGISSLNPEDGKSTLARVAYPFATRVDLSILSKISQALSLQIGFPVVFHMMYIVSMVY